MLEQTLSSISLPFVAFCAFALFTVAGALGVAFSRNLVYSAFSLLATFAGMVALFAFLSADFLAVVQLMVYVGGILVLILFAVMLTNKITEVKHSNPSGNLAVGWIMFLLLGSILVAAITTYPWPTKAPGEMVPTAEIIGDAFLGPYLLPFEVAGLMLLAALLAAVVVARKEIPHADQSEENAAAHGEAA